MTIALHRRTQRSTQQRYRALQLIAVVALLTLLAGLPGAAIAQSTSSIEGATAWLVGQRLDSGAFPGFDGNADPGTTVDAVTALATAGALEEAEESLGYLEGEALVYAQTGPGTAAKLALMLVATGNDPHDFASVDSLSIVEHAAAAGMIGFGPYDHALGLLALAAGGSETPQIAIDAALQSKTEGTGWAFDGSTAPEAADTNTTALMIQAAHAAGFGGNEVVAEATDWLRSLQLAEGFPYQPGGPADSNSTALSLQALNDAEVDNLSDGLTSLAAFQNDNGSFSWLLDPRDDNLFSTLQAIPALVEVSEFASVPLATPPATSAPDASPAAGHLASPVASPVALLDVA